VLALRRGLVLIDGLGVLRPLRLALPVSLLRLVLRRWLGLLPVLLGLLRLICYIGGLRRDGLDRLRLVRWLWLSGRRLVLGGRLLRSLLRRLSVLLAFVAVPLRILLDEIHLAAALRTRTHGSTSKTIVHYG